MKIALLLCLSLTVWAQNKPSFDPRISLATIIREDIFAGFLANDLQRFERGEKNLEILLKERPEARASLLAWKGSTFFYRAVRHYEAKRDAEFGMAYRDALLTYDDAQTMTAEKPDVGVMAVIGGTYAILGDRLPPQYRKSGWGSAYRAFQGLWKLQSEQLDKLPPHVRGELLAGMALSAQRTGHTAEVAPALDRIIARMPATPYAVAAQKWKATPEAAEKIKIACLGCHDAGRLDAVRSKLGNSQKKSD